MFRLTLRREEAARAAKDEVEAGGEGVVATAVATTGTEVATVEVEEDTAETMAKTGGAGMETDVVEDVSFP